MLYGKKNRDETFIVYLERMAGVGEARRHMERLERSLDQPEKLAEYEEWQKTFERLGGYQFRQRARGILENHIMKQQHRTGSRRQHEGAGDELRQPITQT